MEMAKTKPSDEEALRIRTIPMDDEMWEKAQELAARIRISASAWVRIAIMEKIERDASARGQLR